MRVDLRPTPTSIAIDGVRVSHRDGVPSNLWPRRSVLLRGVHLHVDRGIDTLMDVTAILSASVKSSSFLDVLRVALRYIGSDVIAATPRISLESRVGPRA